MLTATGVWEQSQLPIRRENTYSYLTQWRMSKNYNVIIK